MCLVPIDPALLTELENRQQRFIERAGFDPNTFSSIGLADFRFLHLKIALARVIVSVIPGQRGSEIRALLKQLQVHAKNHLPNQETYVRAMSDVAREFPPPQSKLQRVDDHYFLCDVLRAIDGATPFCAEPLQKSLANALNSTHLVTAPMGRCNGFVLHHRSTKMTGIVLDDEIGRSITQISLLLARVMRNDQGRLRWDASFAQNLLENDPGVLLAGESFIRSFLTNGSSIATPPPLSAGKDVDIMVILTRLSFAWCVAHELGHIAMGHLTEGRGSAAMLEEVEMDELDPYLQHEVDADAYADQVTRAIAQSLGQSDDIAFIASGIVVRVYRAIYRTIARKVAPTLCEKDYDEVLRKLYRHPSPRERIRASSFQSYNTRANEISDFLEFVFSKLSENVNVTSLRLHSRWVAFAQQLELLRHYPEFS